MKNAINNIISICVASEGWFFILDFFGIIEQEMILLLVLVALHNNKPDKAQQNTPNRQSHTTRYQLRKENVQSYARRNNFLTIADKCVSNTPRLSTPSVTALVIDVCVSCVSCVSRVTDVRDDESRVDVLVVVGARVLQGGRLVSLCPNSQFCVVRNRVPIALAKR
jgi:hypothetical protein